MTSPIMMTQLIDAPGTMESMEAMSNLSVIGNNPETEGEENGNEKEMRLESADEESSEESNQESSEEEVVAEAGDEGQEEKSEETDSPAVKFMEAYKGDEKFQIPEDAVFKVKVDGKELEVTLPELQKNYQGKIPWERHYHESKQKERDLDARSVSLEAKETSAQKQLDDIIGQFEKNPYLAFDMIAEMGGKNPADYLPVYIAQSQRTLEELKTLSDAQLQALIIQKKVGHDKKLLDKKEQEYEKKTASFAQREEITQAESWLEKEIRQHGFTQEELTMAQDILKEHKDLPNMKPKQIAEQMKEYIIRVERPFSMVESAAREVDPALVQDRKLIAEIKNLIGSDFTKSDVALILKEYLKDSTLKPTSKGVASQVNGSAKGSNSGAEAKPKKVAQKQEAEKVGGEKDIGPMNFWDLVSEYN